MKAFETHRVRASLEGDALCVSFGTEGGFTLRAQDEIDGVRCFPSAGDWTGFNLDGLACAKFTAEVQTPHGSCRASYTLASLPEVDGLLIAMRLYPDDSAKPELPIQWLHFSTEAVTAVHTLHPQWRCDTADMKQPISFPAEMVLQSNEGCVGFFHGGEPIFNPKTNVACPDLWAEKAGYMGFDTLYTSVLIYRPNADDLTAMQHDADELYRQAGNLLRKPETTFEGTEHRYTCGALSFALTENDHGAALTRIRSIGREASFALPLVQLCLRDLTANREFTVDTRSGWRTVRIFEENGGGRLQLSGLERWPELSLELTFQMDKKQQRVQWNTYVLNGEQQLSVLSASYVPAPWQAAKADCFIPEHCGWVGEDVTAFHFSRNGIYPRGWLYTMSYFTAYTDAKADNGFYYGLHDPRGTFRTMDVETNPVDQTGLFFARAYAPGMGKGGNAFELPGQIVWQVFSGNWYDATLIYKAFVRRHAEWLPKVGPEGREDTPQWAKELPVWIMDWMPNTNPLAEVIPTSLTKNGVKLPDDYWYAEPIKLQRALGVPIGYHVYNWHWIPFNNDYPHYLPAKKEFVEHLNTLRQNQIRVMPYINARLWDTHDHEGEDRYFTPRAKAWATKDAGGRLFTEKYESHEPNGELCELAAMCPSSAVWKNQMAKVLRGLFDGLHVDGVYMDQIAAAAPYPCEDPAHNHLPGGGSWWAEQYNLLVRRSRQIRGEEGILTTEDNAEVYMSAMDGFLSWLWTFDNLVPAFSVLYAGYVMMLGRTTNGLKKGDDQFLRYETAEQLVFGGQLGWLNADVAERPRELTFLRKMASVRYRYAPFFYKGEALRPATLETDRPKTVTTPIYFDTKLEQLKPVVTGTWKLWDASRAVLFLINCDTQEAEFTAQLEAESTVLIEGTGALTMSVYENGRLTLHGRIGAEDYLILELFGV